MYTKEQAKLLFFVFSFSTSELNQLMTAFIMKFDLRHPDVLQ